MVCFGTTPSLFTQVTCKWDRGRSAANSFVHLENTSQSPLCPRSCAQLFWDSAANKTDAVCPVGKAHYLVWRHNSFCVCVRDSLTIQESLWMPFSKMLPNVDYKLQKFTRKSIVILIIMLQPDMGYIVICELCQQCLIQQDIAAVLITTIILD